MNTETVHTLILGAGPSGLAAGFTLAKAKLKPVLLEKDKDLSFNSSSSREFLVLPLLRVPLWDKGEVEGVLVDLQTPEMHQQECMS